MFRPLLKTKLLTATLVTVAAIAPAVIVNAADAPVIASAPAGYSAPDPAAQLRASVQRFRHGDLAGLAQSLIPPKHWEEARTAYELKRLEPLPEHARQEFADKLAELTGPEATERFIESLRPKLAEARAQWPGAQLMAFGAMAMAVESPDSELTESQREALRSALPGLQDWMASTDFLSEDTLRQALELLADGLRKTGIDDLEQLRELPFDAVLERSRSLLEAAKQASRLYGLDLDALADSFEVEVLAIDSRNAKVRSSVLLFGAPVWLDHELVLVDGRWYGSEMARRWASVDEPDLKLELEPSRADRPEHQPEHPHGHRG
jgi:hypothetical protein